MKSCTFLIFSLFVFMVLGEVQGQTLNPRFDELTLVSNQIAKEIPKRIQSPLSPYTPLENDQLASEMISDYLTHPGEEDYFDRASRVSEIGRLFQLQYMAFKKRYFGEKVGDDYPPLVQDFQPQFKIVLETIMLEVIEQEMIKEMDSKEARLRTLNEKLSKLKAIPARQKRIARWVRKVEAERRKLTPELNESRAEYRAEFEPWLLNFMK